MSVNKWDSRVRYYCRKFRDFYGDLYPNYIQLNLGLFVPKLWKGSLLFNEPLYNNIYIGTKVVPEIEYAQIIALNIHIQTDTPEDHEMIFPIDGNKYRINFVLQEIRPDYIIPSIIKHPNYQEFVIHAK